VKCFLHDKQFATLHNRNISSITVKEDNVACVSWSHLDQMMEQLNARGIITNWKLIFMNVFIHLSF
jgi:hypothetical protein